jgi:uncharacterized protein YbcI
MEGASTPSADAGSGLTELARAIVRLYKQRLGHGPTKARAYRADDEILLCVMEGTLTTKERTLHEGGADHGLLESRAEVQEILKGEIGAEVERALGRRVRSVVGGVDPDSDIATQTFLLEPVDSE